MDLASSTTEEAGRTVKQAAQAVKEQIRAGSEEVYVSAKSEAERVAVERRDDVAGYAHDISDALGAACNTLDERGRGTAAHLLRRAADEIGGIGERVHGQDIGEVMHTVEDFARRRPALFFGGAFLVAFGLIRLLGRSDGDRATGIAR
jgi:hypothetical protein